VNLLEQYYHPSNGGRCGTKPCARPLIVQAGRMNAGAPAAGEQVPVPACMGRASLTAAQHGPVARGQCLQLQQLPPAVPSCRWSGTLSNLLKELTAHLCKRLVAEHSAAERQRAAAVEGAPAWSLLGLLWGCILYESEQRGLHGQHRYSLGQARAVGPG
jgi:hypothetical protein